MSAAAAPVRIDNMLGAARLPTPWTILVAVALALLIGAAPAAAQRCEAPPGTAAIEQYCETVPTGTGDRPTGGAAPTADQSRPAPLPSRTEDALRASGADGHALAELLRDGARERPKLAAPKASKPRREQLLRQAPPAAESDPLHAIQASADSGATLGGGFAWAMLALTLLAIAVAWRSYRRRSDA